MLSTLYAAGTRARRARFARSPALVHHLDRPVISVGNLRVGGSGKTPLVARLAEWLRSTGERPAILSRGYGRREAGEVVVVSDGTRLCADVNRSGDEPFMLARRLPGVAVVVAASRYRAGRVAEQQCGATVHLLDDGFQHLRLARNADIVLVARDDLAHDAVLPAGRLREPVGALRHATAVVVMDASSADAREAVAGWAAPGATIVGARRHLDAPAWLEDDAEPTIALDPATTPWLTLAGIARPERFVADLTAGGWQVRGLTAFADHHTYSARDIATVGTELTRLGAAAVVTTEKDAVRLLRWRPLPFPVAWVPMRLELQGEDELFVAVRHAITRTRTARIGGEVS